MSGAAGDGAAGDAALLDPIREHLAAEAARDIEWTLRTVTEDCRYDFPLQNLTIVGRARLREYYALLFASRPGKTLASRIADYRIGDDGAVIAECEITYQIDGVPKTTPFTAIFGVRDGLLSSERVYVTQHQDWVHEWRRSHG